MTIFIDLISNVALLLALSILYSFLTRIWKHGEITGQILAGLLFGGVAVAGMILPFHYGPGVIFDGRSIVLSMAGLFGGPVTAAISTLIAGSYRLGLGGTGALTGAGVIFTSAALGVCYHYLRRKNPAVIKPLYLFAFGVIVHISMLLWMLTLPWPLAFEVLNKISIPVMLIFPLGTVFLGTLLVDQEERNYAQEALRESEEKYRTLIENAGEAIIVAQDGVIKFANPKGEKLYGRSQEELASKSLTDFIYDEDRNMVGERHKKRLRGEEISKTYPFRIINKAGDTKWVQLSAVPFSWDNKPAVLCYMTDITDLKQAEEALRERTHDLGERIKELNCLYGISNLVEKPDISLEEIFQGLVYLIPPSWQYPEITCSRIILEDKEYKTENFKETNWKQSNEIFVTGKRMGVLEICYLEEKPEIDEGPFLKEERNLIDAITERLGHIIERMQAREEKERLEDQLQQVTKMEAIATLAGGIAHILRP